MNTAVASRLESRPINQQALRVHISAEELGLDPHIGAWTSETLIPAAANLARIEAMFRLSEAQRIAASRSGQEAPVAPDPRVLLRGQRPTTLHVVTAKDNLLRIVGQAIPRATRLRHPRVARDFSRHLSALVDNQVAALRAEVILATTGPTGPRALPTHALFLKTLGLLSDMRARFATGEQPVAEWERPTEAFLRRDFDHMVLNLDRLVGHAPGVSLLLSSADREQVHHWAAWARLVAGDLSFELVGTLRKFRDVHEAHAVGETDPAELGEAFTAVGELLHQNQHARSTFVRLMAVTSGTGDASLDSVLSVDGEEMLRWLEPLERAMEETREQLAPYASYADLLVGKGPVFAPSFGFTGA